MPIYSVLPAKPLTGLLSSAPSAFGNWNSITTAFTGDNSHMQLAVKQQITGAATLGQPTSGYVYTPEAYPVVTFLYNSSGWNNSLSTNSGRTAACAFRTYVTNAGQGDCVAYNATAFVSSTLAGATSWLAEPAVSLFNGDMSAGANSVYLNPYETIVSDGGFGVTAIGNVNNLKRTSSSIPLGDEWWAGFRVQSQGSVAPDVAFSASGPFNIGLDLSYLTLPTSGTGNVPFNFVSAAITLKADQRIYMNATASDPFSESRFPSATGTSYIFYSSGNTGIEAVVGNQAAYLFTQTAAFIYSTTQIAQAQNNHWQFAGAGNGSNPVLSLIGSSDANVSATLTAKGTGQWLLANGNGTHLQVGSAAASIVDAALIQGSAAGSPGVVNYGVTGTDTDIDLLLSPKGAGLIKNAVALITTSNGASTAAFTANMVGSTGGPTTAAQNGWMKFKDSSGATCWLPVWK